MEGTGGSNGNLLLGYEMCDALAMFWLFALGRDKDPISEPQRGCIRLYFMQSIIQHKTTKAFQMVMCKPIIVRNVHFSRRPRC